MVFNYGGMVYRVWAFCGVFLVLGLLCLMISWHKKPKCNKEGVLVGALMILFALGSGMHYCNCLINPEVQRVTAVFLQAERNSRVAPPLPFTMEYQFTSDKLYGIYLDVFAKKEIFPDNFVEGHEYTIYYEENTEIIVKVDPVCGNDLQ